MYTLSDFWSLLSHPLKTSVKLTLLTISVCAAGLLPSVSHLKVVTVRTGRCILKVNTKYFLVCLFRGSAAATDSEGSGFVLQLISETLSSS